MHLPEVSFVMVVRVKLICYADALLGYKEKSDRMLHFEHRRPLHSSVGTDGDDIGFPVEKKGS